MRAVTEAMLRALCLPEGASFPLPADARLTPLALEYCNERNLRPLEGGGLVADDSERKPEHLTSLRGGELVPKTHPCIRLRGKLDTLEAVLLQTQAAAEQAGQAACAAHLAELFALAQACMRAEVTEEPLPAFRLLGLSGARLRYLSHHPAEFFGEAPVPRAGMSALCLALNYLRTQIREAELAAAAAFLAPDGTVARTDLLEALNRMSSAAHLLFVGQMTGKEVADLHG
ncbi:MAG: hypothetical protein LBG83_00945 [Oscillospiraceae bacterium]|jgi:ethanolamine utilization cobalamin adenosyltransferase|nr:hypothetical protein [Oscillospiraceae bacterium]